MTVMSIQLVVAVVLALGAPALAILDNKPQYVVDIVRSRGFDVDEYDVISQGYDLKVYRVINPLANASELVKTPVICSHGVTFDMSNMLSSSTYARPRKPSLNERVTLYTRENGTDDRGLHFYLSNNNYDVWLIEARATNDRNRRRSHDRTYDTSFWDFSLDEQALIDLPTQIDFVLAKTGAQKASLIVYSQSTTLAFGLLSMRPEYSKKLATMIAIGPVVFTNHIKNPKEPITGSLLLFGSSAIAYLPPVLRKISNGISSVACSISFIKTTLCKLSWQVIMGKGQNADPEGTMAADAFKTTSLKTFEQYLRNHDLKEFRMFDYKDEQLNMEHYGQTVPPMYNVSKIDLKTIVLFRGTDDRFSTAEDQMLLIAKLRVPIYEDHILEDYSHTDFMLSPTVTRDVNEPILRILDTITGRPVVQVRHTLGALDSVRPNPTSAETTQVSVDAETDRKLGLMLTSMQGSAAVREVMGQKAQSRFGGVSARPTVPSIREELSGTVEPSNAPNSAPLQQGINQSAPSFQGPKTPAVSGSQGNAQLGVAGVAAALRPGGLMGQQQSSAAVGVAAGIQQSGSSTKRPSL